MNSIFLDLIIIYNFMNIFQKKTNQFPKKQDHLFIIFIILLFY